MVDKRYSQEISHYNLIRTIQTNQKHKRGSIANLHLDKILHADLVDIVDYELVVSAVGLLVRVGDGFAAGYTDVPIELFICLGVRNRGAETVCGVESFG